MAFISLSSFLFLSLSSSIILFILLGVCYYEFFIGLLSNYSYLIVFRGYLKFYFNYYFESLNKVGKGGTGAWIYSLTDWWTVLLFWSTLNGSELRGSLKIL